MHVVSSPFRQTERRSELKSPTGRLGCFSAWSSQEKALLAAMTKEPRSARPGLTPTGAQPLRQCSARLRKEAVPPLARDCGLELHQVRTKSWIQLSRRSCNPSIYRCNFRPNETCCNAPRRRIGQRTRAGEDPTMTCHLIAPASTLRSPSDEGVSA